MAKRVDLNIKSGLPYARTFMVDLPNGRDWWTLGNEWEILSQIRLAESTESDLVLDLAEFITTTVETIDTIRVDLVMTGSDTRKVKKSGHYDIIMSDKLETDTRAYQISLGRVHRTEVVSSDKEALNV